MTKTSAGNFFEDFRLGQTIRHATPRTMTGGDVALYTGLFGAALRGAVVGRLRQGDRLSALRRSTTCWCFTSCSARPCRTSRSTRSPISATPACSSWRRCSPATRLSATSEVIGLKENSNRKTGIVYVRTRGVKQDGTAVLEYVRWVMVRKRDEAAPAPGDHVPRLPTAVEPKLLGGACPPIDVAGLRLRAGRQPAPLRRLCRSARRSTTSTASPSRRPSTRPRRGSIRTPRASISTSSRRRRAASASG